jgi:uncharacterized protein YjaZ
LNVFEKEKVDQSINQDFIKEIESLNSRIHSLEKLMVDCRSSPNAAAIFEHRNTLNMSNLTKKINDNIDKIESLSAKEMDLPNIRNMLQSLETLAKKEMSMEKLLEEIHGFMDYFNDQWNKFNLTVMEQNITISMFRG